MWQEIYDNDIELSTDTVVQVWKENYRSELSEVTKTGYKTILSSCWYLNYIKYGANWIDYYSCDPHDFEGRYSASVIPTSPREKACSQKRGNRQK